jgi:cytochrome c oxidase subunit 2
MFGQIVWFPETASTNAWSTDLLFFFLVTVCGVVGLLVAVLLIGFTIKYRRRPGVAAAPTIPNVPLETFWTITPLIIFMVMFVWGATIYFGTYRPPDDATTIYVVAKQWMWKVQHPEGQREINEMHVPRGQPFRVLLTSEDVIHSFFVPAFRIHMDVLPGRYTSTWFEATKTGHFHLFCSQYCGTNHAGMVGEVIVMEPADYQAWLNDLAEGSLALEGRKVFLKYRCLSCHSANENARAPVLENLYLKEVHLNEGRTVIADENYIRESIYDPPAKVVAGWQPIMPTFRGQIDEEEIIKLIAFIKALGPGQTPRRVEEYPPPVSTPQINPPRHERP